MTKISSKVSGNGVFAKADARILEEDQFSNQNFVDAIQETVAIQRNPNRPDSPGPQPGEMIVSDYR